MNKLIAIVLLSLSFNASALYYKSKNADRDSHCPSWSDERFFSIEDYMTVSVHEATVYSGFDEEVPISRKGVDVVWCAMYWTRGERKNGCEEHIDFDDRPFKRYAGEASLGHTFINFYDLEDQYSQYLSYSFETAMQEGVNGGMNVGLVLEYLSRYYLQEMTGRYPKEIYKITGGVEYKKSNGSRTLGELDIIIYEKESCDVVIVGESKAASRHNLNKALSKARSQLSRFRNALR
jgi:hypothetical protein